MKSVGYVSDGLKQNYVCYSLVEFLSYYLSCLYVAMSVVNYCGTNFFYCSDSFFYCSDSFSCLLSK